MSAKIVCTLYFWAVHQAPVLRLKPGREDSVVRGHPWVFSGALTERPDAYPEGSWAALSDASGRILACGYVCHGSIALRLAHFGAEVSSAGEAVSERLKKALRLRERLGFGLFPGTAFRLLNGEGDGLPGVVIDWYDGVAVVQLHVRALQALWPLISESLRHLLQDSLRAIVVKEIWKAGESFDAKERKPLTDAVRIKEHDIWYEVFPGQGQKTGFYIDQRANRLLCRSLALGRRVLNLFSFTGGFSLNALYGGASEVVSVDVSATALRTLEGLLLLNQFEPGRHRAVEVDAFRWTASHRETYDLVVCDPPSLARSLQARHTAIQAYKRLHEHVMRLVAPGGLLMTFSCTAVVSPEHFEGAVRSAAAVVGRRVRVHRELGADADHPWALMHPEGRYLKGFLLSVE